ncbi:MAG: Trk family potassium uptake protein [Faecalibacterium sp.]|jgi:trk system potassium uptake protein TrkH|nr:Trk family potassium uptake protein [Faecalibacterium sp.]
MKQLLHAHYIRLTYPQIVALGYFLLIAAGTALLCLPAATYAPGGMDVVSSLFTATSATCVTGLVVGDTFTTFTLFGQIVILGLIQVGGLGFMTILAMFGMFLRRRIGLRARTLMKESVNSLYVGGIVRLFHKIIVGTALFEGGGALLLATRFVPKFGWAKGLWFAVFHSISAFCNAGFDLMGTLEPYSSLVLWADDPVVCLTICMLIAVGGIGFFVWADLQKNGLHFSHYQLHTKITLTVTAILIAGGTLLFWVLEADNTLAGMPVWQQILDALFCSVTPRTAGFNVVDTAAMTGSGRLLTVLLMFVGGSSGGTAGGIKTTTLAIIAISSWNSIRNEADNNVFGRRLESDSLRRANAVCTINLAAILIATLAICIAQPVIGLQDALFEATSAIGTVGLSVGTTAAANVFSRLVLVLLMYWGRVGSLSFALLFTENRNPGEARCPEEKVSIG